jgi:hypothetical protein
MAVSSRLQPLIVQDVMPKPTVAVPLLSPVKLIVAIVTLLPVGGMAQDIARQISPSVRVF